MLRNQSCEKAFARLSIPAGMLIRNPLIPGAVILLWESINGILPSTLRHISVIYYLKSLCPVDIPVSPGTPPFLALLVSNSEPVSAPLAWDEIGAEPVAIQVKKKKKYELFRRIAADEKATEDFYLLADLGCVLADSADMKKLELDAITGMA